MYVWFIPEFLYDVENALLRHFGHSSPVVEDSVHGSDRYIRLFCNLADSDGLCTLFHDFFCVMANAICLMNLK